MEDTNALGYQVPWLFFRYGGYKRSWVSGSAVIVPLKRCFPFDSSVGRAEDCRLISVGILRSLVQLRLEGSTFHCCKLCHGVIEMENDDAS